MYKIYGESDIYRFTIIYSGRNILPQVYNKLEWPPSKCVFVLQAVPALVLLAGGSYFHLRQVFQDTSLGMLSLCFPFVH
jgi:hypothetical protein